MTNPLILIDAINLARYPVAPFTHVLDIRVGAWTHTSRLELPGLVIAIYPAPSPHQYVLGAASELGELAIPFDRNLSHFAAAVSELSHAYQRPYPVATHHLVQGAASALVYFGRQFGYIEVDSEGEVTATNKRKDTGI